jgi:DNA-binding NarL/FixJ family response regulator
MQDTWADGVRRVDGLRPEVVLVDVDLGGESGFDLARRSANAPTPRVILISTHAKDDFDELIEESPAAGFISKSELSAAAIEAVLGGASGSDLDATRG